MEKHDARFLVRHVLMDRHDVDLVLEQCFQDRLQFVFGHREVAINYGVAIVAGERRPCVHAHIFVDRDAVHLCRATDREFHHSVFRFALRSEDFVKRHSGDRTFSRQRLSTERIFRLWICRSNLFGSVVDFFDRARQLLSSAFAFDMHEENSRLIEEEMIVEGRDAQAVIERSGHRGIHFVLEQHGVAHYHRAVWCRRERCPGAEAHEWRYFPPIHDDLHVVARKGDFINAFFLIHFSF